ncbi:uncharacterized protein LOC127735391 isoform X1 [Mytilus californianus]|uniref:uncharacterized protein LOC127735391 isoform X1 n=1 Tax=Mytilus californianus TaxID=6549 RepID=UPI00224608A6|nr:uncharacterized protein LOC127735391 isoform X1 [Mytilus californianus]
MRKSATGFSYRCRLTTLLLILQVYIVDASKISTKFKPDLGLQESTFPKITDSRFVFATDFKPNLYIDENPIPDKENQEPSRRRRYWIESRCSEMFVRIRPGTRRNSIDASGKKTPPGRYTSIIMESIGRNGLVRLQGEDSLMYLCFNNKGRLRARHHPLDSCNLVYNITHDKYYQFRLADEDHKWFIGFKKKKLRNSVRGKALPGYKKKPNTRLERCYDFTLIAIDQHNTTPSPYSPVNFHEYSDNWDPQKKFHKLRRMKKYKGMLRKGHRKMDRRRQKKKRQKSKKRKPPGR